ncbi:MAG: hypothetical protein WDZ65_06350, partial [Aquisalimonadaceae bacterium]
MRFLSLLFLLVLLSACAAVPREPLALPGSDAGDRACLAFFTALEREVLAANVRDGAGAPIPDHPWFRSSRFIHGASGHLNGDALAGALLTQDRRARAMELRNLPAAVSDALVAKLPQTDAGTAVDDCGRRLTARLLAADPELNEVRAGVAVADDYITWHRWAGLYPLSRYFILAGVSIWQRGTRASFATEAPEQAPGLRFEPIWRDAVTPVAAVRRLVAAAPRDALGRLDLSELQADLLLGAYAPIIELETDQGHNRIGEPLWEAPGTPNVNVAWPVVYTDVTYTRFNGETIPQLNYVLWFSSRPKAHALDLLGGRLDGITVRITLDNNGAPLLLETMHNCGCYHQHYPLSGLAARARPAYGEPPLVLPSPGPPGAGERLVLRLRDRSHYVFTVYLARAESRDGRPYVLKRYHELRSLPAAEGRRSLFQADGLVPGTRRDEQVIFWVSGVPAPGAMRQLGRHVTAFAGRRHFDDIDLLER